MSFANAPQNQPAPAVKTTVSPFVLKALSKAKMFQPLSDEQKVALRNLDFAVDTDETGNGMRLTDQGEAAIARPRMVKENDMAKKKAAPSKKVLIAQKDAVYTKKYKHFVPGSLRKAEGETKLRCEITCQAEGTKKSPECKGERTIYSSDIFQVKTCEKCRDYTIPKPQKAKKAKKVLKAKVRIKKTPKAKDPAPEAAAEPERLESPATESAPAVDPETAQ